MERFSDFGVNAKAQRCKDAEKGMNEGHLTSNINRRWGRTRISRRGTNWAKRGRRPQRVARPCGVRVCRGARLSQPQRVASTDVWSNPTRLEVWSSGFSRSAPLQHGQSVYSRTVPGAPVCARLINSRPSHTVAFFQPFCRMDAQSRGKPAKRRIPLGFSGAKGGLSGHILPLPPPELSTARSAGLQPALGALSATRWQRSNRM